MDNEGLWRDHYGELLELMEELNEIAIAAPISDPRLVEWVSDYRSDLTVLMHLSRFETLLDDPFFNYGNGHSSCRIVVTERQRKNRQALEALVQDMSSSDSHISREWGEKILTAGHSIILHERTVGRLIGGWFKDFFVGASKGEV